MNQGHVTETTETEPIQPMLPGMEYLAAENEALKSEIRMRTAAYDIETQLARAGVRRPKLLSEQAKAGFQFDDEGRLVNAAAMIENLRRSYPEQFSATSIDAGAGRSSGPTLTKEALSRMSLAEIRRLDWAEVRTVLAS